MTRTRFAHFRPVTFLIFLGLVVCSVAVHAEGPAQARAARLTFLQGTVTIDQAQGAAGLPAQLNLPLLTGTQVTTGDDGQAEVEFEDGSIVRLTPNSALSLDNLAVDPGGVFETYFSLVRGLAYFELRATQQYRYTLNAGGDLISPVENTTVRISFDEPPPIIAVLDGTAHVEHVTSTDSGPEATTYQTDVRAGESLSADAGDPNRYFLQQVIAGDSWDQWNEDMDQAAAAQAADGTSVRNDYAGAQGYGWSDLDANGTWYDVPGAGQVWQPYGADDEGWDPYGNGSWVAYPGFGYVWASANPWGWTPYRCGNWSYFGGFGWGWAPGASCGGAGWGFVGGGRPVNIAVGRPGHPPIRVPTPGHGPERPLLQVHNGPILRPVPRPSDGVQQQRQIAGVTAKPIQRVGNGFASSGPVVGSSLRRDFPVDAKTRVPIDGLASTRPAAVRTVPVWQSQQIYRPAPATEARPATNPAYDGQSHPAPAVRNPPAYQQQRQGGEAPRYTPPQQNQPRYSPPPQQQAPRYSPPPQQQSAPRYSPPPQQSHPSYSPPPSNAPARAPR